jgi:thioredoxin reductase
MHTLPVAIIGAGPVGLATVARLIERDLPFVILEAGSRVGTALLDWGHVHTFSNWGENIDDAAQTLLEQAGWQAPNLTDFPTGAELVERYLQPLADLPQIAPHVHLNSRVTAVARQRLDKMKDNQREAAPFVVRYLQPEGEAEVLAQAVIDASGTWMNPNPLGANGLTALGETQARAHIFYGIPNVLDTNRARYANRRVMVVGSGHSANNALLDLAMLQEHAPDTQVFWAVRRTNMDNLFGGGLNDELPERGRLGLRLRGLYDRGQLTMLAGFLIQQVQLTPNGVSVVAEDGRLAEVDEIICATGLRPDLSFLREVRIQLDPAVESTPTLAPMIDPNLHSCGTVRPHGEAELRHPEKNFYIVGMKSYGRAPTFLLKTGYEQVRSVVAELAGDHEASRKVELVLPETGVCCGTGGSTIALDAIAFPVLSASRSSCC